MRVSPRCKLPNLGALATILGCICCGGQESDLRQHREALASLASTTAAIGEAWLAGRVSGTYAGTALNQTFVLLERERRSIARSPQALLDPRRAELSQREERLSRLLALMLHDVRAADASSLRRRVTEIPLEPPDLQ
jgi:hypothetical protein